MLNGWLSQWVAEPATDESLGLAKPTCAWAVAEQPGQLNQIEIGPAHFGDADITCVPEKHDVGSLHPSIGGLTLSLNRAIFVSIGSMLEALNQMGKELGWLQCSPAKSWLILLASMSKTPSLFPCAFLLSLGNGTHNSWVHNYVLVASKEHSFGSSLAKNLSHCLCTMSVSCPQLPQSPQSPQPLRMGPT